MQNNKTFKNMRVAPSLVISGFKSLIFFIFIYDLPSGGSILNILCVPDALKKVATKAVFVLVGSIFYVISFKKTQKRFFLKLFENFLKVSHGPRSLVTAFITANEAK